MNFMKIFSCSSFKSLFIICLCLFTVFWTVRLTNAYSLTGSAWVLSKVDDLTYKLSGSSSINSVWNDAIYNWNQQSIVPNFDAKVTSGHDVEFKEIWDPDTDNDGYAFWSHDSSRQIYYAYAWINSAYTQKYSSLKARSVASHEIGHILGLDHTSVCSLMESKTSDRYDRCGVYTPQADDLRGINNLY